MGGSTKPIKRSQPRGEFGPFAAGPIGICGAVLIADAVRPTAQVRLPLDADGG